VTAAEDSSPLAPWTLIPWCATSTPAQPETWYEAAIFLGAQAPEESPTVSWGGPAAHLTWPDGTTDTVDTSTIG
jgi:hypothetical protein